MKDKVQIRTTRKYGKGLYATKNIKKGEIVEISPVVVLDKCDSGTLSSTKLNVYVFEWNKSSSALALGVGSLFNHCSNHRLNVTYMNSFGTKEIVFMTSRSVKKGEQLFINYGYDPKYGLDITERNKKRDEANTDKGPFPKPNIYEKCEGIPARANKESE
jgi:uncharacterized protein